YNSGNNPVGNNNTGHSGASAGHVGNMGFVNPLDGSQSRTGSIMDDRAMGRTFSGGLTNMRHTQSYANNMGMASGNTTNNNNNSMQNNNQYHNLTPPMSQQKHARSSFDLAGMATTQNINLEQTRAQSARGIQTQTSLPSYNPHNQAGNGPANNARDEFFGLADSS
ncbi:hypothetical protein SARC_16826, partial [Sphaeroforma arctica JP610]